MAQKFLPSHRKWLDYEAVFNREAFLFFSLFSPAKSQRSGRMPERFFA